MTKIVLFGDPDTTSDADDIYTAVMKETNVDLYVNIGDNGYSGNPVSFIKKYFPTDSEQYKKLILILGNHDNEESESAAIEKALGEYLPEQYKSKPEFDGTDQSWEDTRWLTSRVVGDIYFIGMNSQDMDIEFKRNQFNWVTKEIENAKTQRQQGKIKWILNAVHKPWFTLKSSHSPYTAVREIYSKMFEDVVNQNWHGHNHNDQSWVSMIATGTDGNAAGEMKQSLLEDGKTIDHSKPHGWTTNVQGHSGHEHNKFKENATANKNIMWANDKTFSYSVVESNGDLLNTKWKDKAGTVLHEYNISQAGTTNPPDPEPCKQNECKDPVTNQCRAIGPNETVDTNGFCKPTTPPDPTTIVCPENYELDPSLGYCIPLIEPNREPKCPTGYTWNSTKKICEKDGTIPPVDCTNPNECKDPSTQKCRAIGANEQKNPTTGLCESKIVTGCKDNECKDVSTGKCRLIGPNEEKDANGFCKTKTPEPGGDIDANGMRLLHKTTGQSVDMEKGSDHRNGQRYNVNHKYLNYMVQGYFKLGKGQAKIEHKTDGPNHGGCTKLPICMWYELGYEIATGRSELQYEAPHPDNHDIPDSALDLQVEVKCQPESWIGYQIAIWDSAEGRRMEQHIDPDPFDAAGKPKNGWIKALQATEKGQLFPKEYYPRNLKELIPKFENGFESEIRMHQGTNHDTEMKWVKVYEIVPPN